MTGPTGSGKSSTQAAIIDIINEKKHYHVVTIEDPIEYLHYAQELNDQSTRSRTRHEGFSFGVACDSYARRRK